MEHAPTDAATIAARYAQVCDRVDAATRRVGRVAGSVTLVVVTKTFGLEAIRAAVAAGARDLGENYVQEAAEKIGALASDAAAAGGLLRWHFIGHLQSNKVARAIPLFDRIHTLDSPRLAREVERVAGQTGRTVRALVQVNVSGESTKRGLPPEAVADFLSSMTSQPHLQVEGLMTIPPVAPRPEASRPYFRRLATLAHTLTAQGFDLPHLSMGMTDDFEVAIEEGATIVRVGRAIFGPRPALARLSTGTNSAS
jgi:pyridoxal phosphate enzyme (YggS family)